MEVLKKYISPHQLDNYLLDVCLFKTPELLLPSSGLVQLKRSAVLLVCPKTLMAWAHQGRFFSESVSVFSPCFLLYLNLIMTTSYASFQGFLGHTQFRRVWFWDRQRTGSKCMWVCACVWELLFFSNLISSFLNSVIRAAWQGLNLSFWYFHVLQQHN